MRFGPAEGEFVEELYLPATYPDDQEALVRDWGRPFPLEWLPTDDDMEGKVHLATRSAIHCHWDIPKPTPDT